jgi:hypothetical protein
VDRLRGDLGRADRDPAADASDDGDDLAVAADAGAGGDPPDVRPGGAQSPRVVSYVAQAATTWGMSSYNPLAGPHAADAVNALLAIDVERVALEAATAASHALQIAEPALLADVAREARAELTRVAWTARHGWALTLRAVLEREGLARAVGDETAPPADEPWGDIGGIVARDGDMTGLDRVAPVLFGDAVAETLGWTPRGLPPDAGLRWAAAEARKVLRKHGAPAALGQTG